MHNKVLVTGGNGFIGSIICKRLMEMNVDFLALSNQPTPFIAPERFRDISITDREALMALFEEYRPNIVFHLAAIASPAHKNVSEIYSVNVTGSENILDATKQFCPKGARVLLVSTAGVYGNQDVLFLHEDLPYNPVNHYSYSKTIMEIMSRQYEDALQIRIVRPFNIIGLGQSENFFIPKLVKHFASRSPVLQLGNLEAKRDYVDVEFCIRVMMKFSFQEEVPHHILNICSGIPHSCIDIINILEGLTGFRPEIRIQDEFVRSNEIWRLVGSPDRLNPFIGDDFSVLSVENVLKAMLNTYQAQA